MGHEYKHIKMPLKTIPMELDTSFTPAEAIMKLMFKINELIDFENDINEKLDNLSEEVASEVLAIVRPKIASIDSKVDNIQQNVNTQLTNTVNQINTELRTFENRINGNLTTLETNLKKYVDDKIAELQREELITAYGYDRLEITAQAFDNIQMTADEYDTISKMILESI